MSYDYTGLRIGQQGGDGSEASYAYVGTEVHAWQRGTTLTHLMVQGEGHIRSVGIQDDGTALNRQFHADGLGSTVATSTGSQGIETRYQTDAWGNVQAGEAKDNPFVYGGGDGYWQEPDLGLTYVQARWLDTQTGSWLSVDPVSSEPLYSYAHNSPTAYTDPTGTQGISTQNDTNSTWDWWEGFLFGQTGVLDRVLHRGNKLVPRRKRSHGPESIASQGSACFRIRHHLTALQSCQAI